MDYPIYLLKESEEILKIKMSIIPYDIYTYENLINVCLQEDLSLCNDLKLRYQLTNLKQFWKKKQLGEFCSQFAVDDPKPPWKDWKFNRKEYKPHPHYKREKIYFHKKKENKLESSNNDKYKKI